MTSLVDQDQRNLIYSLIQHLTPHARSRVATPHPRGYTELADTGRPLGPRPNSKGIEA